MFLTSTNLFTLYKAQVSPCWMLFISVEKSLQAFYCHPGCNSETSYQTNKQPTLIASFDSPVIRRSVSLLSLFHRFYHGMCSDKLKSIIPSKPASKLRLRGTYDSTISPKQNLILFGLSRSIGVASSWAPICIR